MTKTRTHFYIEHLTNFHQHFCWEISFPIQKEKNFGQHFPYFLKIIDGLLPYLDFILLYEGNMTKISL